MISRILTSVSQQEIEKTSERTKIGLARAIKVGGKNGMSKQVYKSDVFTKESLRKLQDKMKILCVESFNKEYNCTNSLKKKQKDRNRDII